MKLEDSWAPTFQEDTTSLFQVRNENSVHATVDYWINTYPLFVGHFNHDLFFIFLKI